MNEVNEYFDVKKLDYTFDLSKANFQLDAIQERNVEFYLRADKRFRTAFNTNYTSDFIQFIKDKVRLNEPVPMATMGNVRGGKSYGMISVCCVHQAIQGRKFTVDYICAHEYEFIEKLQQFPQDKLFGRIFLIDEEKQSVYGTGSVAKKMKMTDIANIIAINNISVIRINPTRFPQQEVAWYGLRVFGRDMNQKLNRYMLYDLQQGERGGMRPLGMVYIPIFTKLLPKEYGDELEKAYLRKKNEWVMLEQSGKMDILAELKKKTAEKFVKENQFLSLNKKERLTYIIQTLGSEWTKGECEDILTIAQMLERGVKFK